jgi:hypothetical protein
MLLQYAPRCPARGIPPTAPLWLLCCAPFVRPSVLQEVYPLFEPFFVTYDADPASYDALPRVYAEVFAPTAAGGSVTVPRPGVGGDAAVAGAGVDADTRSNGY